jgi:hypothetical protein
MDDHKVERPMPDSPPRLEGAHEASEPREQLALEWEQLRFERQKHALELRLRRRELTEKQKSSIWKDLLATPLTIAIVGGVLTLLTTIVTNFYTARANREAETARADLARASAQETLQADLIKKFVESPSKDTVRENLRFLVDAGLLPTYAGSIKGYLAANPASAPQLGSPLEFSSAGETVPDVLKERLQTKVSQFRVFLQEKGFNGLDDHVSVFVYSKDAPPPKKYGVSGEDRGSFYDNNTLFIHKDLSEDVSYALREYTHHALGTAVGPEVFPPTDVESALADYLPATFLDSPALGGNLPKSVGLQSAIVRNLNNTKSYDGADPTDPLSRGVVWAGALWACRQREGRGVDDLVLSAWRHAMVKPVQDNLVAQRFGTALAVAAPPFGQCFSEEIARRKLPRNSS